MDYCSIGNLIGFAIITLLIISAVFCYLKESIYKLTKRVEELEKFHLNTDKPRKKQ